MQIVGKLDDPITGIQHAEPQKLDPYFIGRKRVCAYYDNNKIRRNEEETSRHKEENEKKPVGVGVYRSTTVGVRLTHSHGPSPRGEIMPPPRIVNNFKCIDVTCIIPRHTRTRTVQYVITTMTATTLCVVCKLLFFVIFRFSKI